MPYTRHCIVLSSNILRRKIRRPCRLLGEILCPLVLAAGIALMGILLSSFGKPTPAKYVYDKTNIIGPRNDSVIVMAPKTNLTMEIGASLQRQLSEHQFLNVLVTYVDSEAEIDAAWRKAPFAVSFGVLVDAAGDGDNDAALPAMKLKAPDVDYPVAFTSQAMSIIKPSAREFAASGVLYMHRALAAASCANAVRASGAPRNATAAAERACAALVEHGTLHELATRKQPSIIYQFLGAGLASFWVMAFIPVGMTVVAALIDDKTRGIREGLRLFGVSKQAYWTSWLVVFTCEGLLVVLLMAAVGFASGTFSNSSPTIVLSLLSLWTLSAIAFGFLAATLTNSAMVGAAIVFAFFYLTGNLQILATSSLISNICGPLAPVIFSIGFGILFRYEAAGAPLTLSALNVVDSVSGVSLARCMLWLAVDALLYAALAAYVSAVWPGAYGSPLPWHLNVHRVVKRALCGNASRSSGAARSGSGAARARRSSARVGGGARASSGGVGVSGGSGHHESHSLLSNVANQHSSGAEADASTLGALPSLYQQMQFAIEDDTAHGAAERREETVNLERLCKRYAPEPAPAAVVRTDLTLYEGEIVALLGENGAGKTTTISCMTGVISPTSGDATICGHSIVNDTQAARAALGVCPQHDVLFEELSSVEHMHFYARLRGVRLSEQEIRALLVDDVGLAWTDAHKKVTTLSGGARRKLSLAIAFIGNPKVLLLDEPTSGLDPDACRVVWSLLKRKRRELNATIVCSTHRMSEAEAIADRVAIMTHGYLSCMGTPLWLKKRLAEGYFLHCDMAARDGVERADALLRYVRSHVEEAHAEEITNSLVSIVLPFDALSRFPALLSDLEEKRANYGVESFGVSAASLDEVFLHVNRKASDIFMEKREAESSMQQGKPRSYGAASTSTNNNEGVGRTNPEAHLLQNAEQCARSTLKDQIHTITRFRLVKSWKAWLTIALLPAFFCFISYLPKGTNKLSYDIGNTDNSPIQLSPHLLVDGSGSPALPLPYVCDNNKTATSCDDVVGEVVELASESVKVDLRKFKNVEALGKGIVDDVNTGYAGGLVDVSFVDDGLLGGGQILANFSVIFSPLVLQNLYSSVAIERIYGDLNVSSVSAPLPNNSLPLRFEMQAWLSEEISSTAFAVQPYFPIGLVLATMSSISAYVIGFEQERLIRRQLSAIGLRNFAYWIGAFIADSVVLVISLASISIVLFAMSVDTYTGARFVGFATLSLAFTPALIVETLLLATLFSKASTAAVFVPIMHCVFAIAAYLVPTALFKEIFSRELPSIIKNIAICVSPGSCYMNALGTFNEKSMITVADAFTWDTTVRAMLYVLLWAALGMALLLLVADPERRRGRRVKCDELPPLDSVWRSVVNNDRYYQHAVTGEIVQGLPTDNPGVLSERAAVLAGSSSNHNDDDAAAAADDECDDTNAVRIKRLYKTYDFKKYAVRDVSLQVRKGTVQGLLGPNGAGKSSTIGCAIRSFPLSFGDVTAPPHGASVRTAAEAYWNASGIGVCLQDNSLYDALTVEQHLDLYCRVRGRVPQANALLRANVIDFYVDACALSEHRRKAASALSGGTKRKLCLALSLIGGGADALFVDESSTGVDPYSRRALWAAIRDAADNGRACIFTSHDLAEVDEVCERVAIVVNGALQAVGTSQELKSRFASYYRLIVRVQSVEHVDVFERWAREQFPESELLECFGTLITMRLGAVSRLGSVFEVMLLNREDLHVVDFQLHQPSLESVFLEFSKAQRDETQK